MPLKNIKKKIRIILILINYIKNLKKFKQKKMLKKMMNIYGGILMKVNKLGIINCLVLLLIRDDLLILDIMLDGVRILGMIGWNLMMKKLQKLIMMILWLWGVVVIGIWHIIWYIEDYNLNNKTSLNFIFLKKLLFLNYLSRNNKFYNVTIFLRLIKFYFDLFNDFVMKFVIDIGLWYFLWYFFKGFNFFHL